MRAAAYRLSSLLVVLVAASAVGEPRAADAAGQLAGKTLQKAAVACEKVLAKTGSKVLATKLKLLDACANAALTCVQTKAGDGACLEKAATVCAKKLGGFAGVAEKARATIVGAKSCGSTLRYPELLSDDGLGLGTLVGPCQADFGLDVCAGLGGLADCLVRSHDRAAGRLYGEARPRTAELLALLPGAPLPAVAGLPVVAGCASCSVPRSDRAPVEACGRALTKARQKLLKGVEAAFGGCAEKVFACTQTKADDACFAKARAACDKGATKVRKAYDDFGAGLAKACGPASLDFSRVADPSGLNLAALAGACEAAPADVGALTACLRDQAACQRADLVRAVLPRIDELGADGRLGALGVGLAATCVASPSPSPTPASIAARVGVFGSIRKIIAGVRRTAGTPGVVKPGGRPAPGLGGRAGITKVGGPGRVNFGSVAKISFRYRTGFGRAPVLEPPTLIVSVQRADLVLEDHFQVPLPPAPVDPTEIDDEIEVTYADELPGCGFILGLALRDEGVVSDYAAKLQVLDAAVPTPTVTPTPVPNLCPIAIEVRPNGAEKSLDLGWTGFGHRQPVQQDGLITFSSSCNATAPPCGFCTLDDVVPNAKAGAGDLDSRRCSGDTSVRCEDATDCVGIGPCLFHFGPPLAVTAGGVSGCIVNAITGNAGGTVNYDTGGLALTIDATARVFTAAGPDVPCPQCVGDLALNDGQRDGTCSAGPRAGQSCDANGGSIYATFGPSSFDCPPVGSAIGNLPIALNGSTNTEQVLISNASQPCGADPSRKCVCGGGGGTSLPNACLDDTATPGATPCVADSPTTGSCPLGPVEGSCTLERFRGCIDNAGCPAPGDTCTFANRACYLDNGIVGNALTAVGAIDTPVNGAWSPTYAAVFCVGSTSSSAHNQAYGLPGFGRLQLPLDVQAIVP